jgi:hypothetical protein
MIFGTNRTSRTKFATSEHSKIAMQRLSGDLNIHGFQWSVGAIDDMQCSGSQSGLSKVKGVRFLYR